MAELVKLGDRFLITHPQEKGRKTNGSTQGKNEGKGQGKLTEDEMDQYRKEGRCFRCGNRGHLSFDCPESKAIKEGRK